MIYNVLFAVFDSLLSYITVSYLFSAFSNKLKIRLYHLISILISFSVTVLFDNVIIAVASGVITAYLVSLAYNFKWYFSIFLSLMSVMLQVLSEMIIGMIMMTYFSMSFGETVSGIPYFIGLIISRFLGYFIVYIIKTARQRIFSQRFDGRWLLIFTLPVASIIISVVLFSYIGGFNEPSGILALTGITLLIISNVLIFFFLDTMHEAVLNEEKLLLSEELILKQEERYKELWENNNEIRRIRHDHKNFLLGMIDELEKGNISELKERLQEELDGQKENNMVNSGNSAIDIIIGSKMKIAKKYNISFECNFYRISAMNFESTELSVLIGNALDNAIEGARKVDGEKIIKISVSLNYGQLIFTITNPIREKIDILSLTTTKSDDGNHGFGICSMKRIAERHNGDVVFFSTDDTFKTVIYLKNAE